MSIKVEENFFDLQLVEDLLAYTRTGRQPTRTNFFAYQHSVIGTSNAVFCFDLEADMKQRVANALVKKGVLDRTPKDWQAYVHLFSRGSFIPWHDDSKYLKSITVYLNKTWNDDLGGLFLYEHDGEQRFIRPIFNTAVTIKPPVKHSTTLTAIHAPFRESLQIFVSQY